MNEKIDFLDFQRQMKDQFGVAEPDVERFKRVHILTFFNTPDGKIMARLPGGGVVFRHNEGGMQIGTGETWICELLEKKTTFFAIGLQKLDAKFFFDLRADQVDRLADVIWRDNQSILEPRFEEMYRKSLEDALNVRLQDSKKREEDALAKVKELEQDLEAVSAKNRMVIAKLEEELKEAKERAQKQIATAAPEPSSPALPMPVNLRPHIRRVSADELYSEDFRQRNYFVHVSADQGLMTIRPHDQGNVVCLDRRITLVGLSLISPFSGPVDMPAEYDPRYGGYVVSLKYIPTSDEL